MQANGVLEVGEFSVSVVYSISDSGNGIFLANDDGVLARNAANLQGQRAELHTEDDALFVLITEILVTDDRWSFGRISLNISKE